MTFYKFNYNNSFYYIFIHNNHKLNCILIIGKNQEGNDYIISNAPLILKTHFNIISNNESLIWLHGYGPSPHFIIYVANDIMVNSNEIEIFIKNTCPEKSNKNMPLTCALLSNIIKTSTKGLVDVIKEEKLNKLLNLKYKSNYNE